MPADPFDLEEAERRWELALRGNPAARAALSTALHDLVGKRLGVPLYRLWGLDPARAPRSTFTIGIDTPEKIRAKVREAAAVSDPQDQARHRPGRGDPPDASATRPTGRSGSTPTAAGP